MNSIQPSIGTGVPAGLGGAALDAASTAAGAAAAKATLAQQELLGKLMDAVAGTTSTRGKDDGVTNAMGAPALAAPAQPFSASDMVDLLRAMRGKAQDGQLKAAKSEVESARQSAERNTEQQIGKINEWMKKCEEASNKSSLGKIFSWIGKIAAVIASAVALAVAAGVTPFSGGLAAPLVALAAVGLVASTMALADQISQEAGGPAISISNLVTTTVGKFLEAVGVPEETASKIGKLMAGVTALAMPAMLLVEPNLLATMTTGICELAGASKEATMYASMAVGIATAITVGIVTAVATGGGSTASSVSSVGASVTANTASTASKIATGAVNASGQIVSGATQVGTGVITIQKAHIERDSENILADKKNLDAAMIKLQQQMEEGREEMKKVIQQIEDGLQAVTQMIAGATDSMSQITANMGKRMSV